MDGTNTYTYTANGDLMVKTGGLEKVGKDKHMYLWRPLFV